METKDTLQKIESKKMKPVDFIYLGVILLLLIITIVMFFFSTSFIMGHINKIFLPIDEVTQSPLNMENYKLVEKKLSLPINTPDGKTIINTPTEEAPIVETIVTTNIEATVIPAIKLDKSKITINVLNGSSKNGVASLLAKNLIKEGFIKTTTGDSKNKYAVTTVTINNNAKDYASLIENIVRKSYPNTVINISPADAEFGVVIIIGGITNNIYKLNN